MNLKRSIPIIVLLSLVVGCATMGVKPWSERSPQDKSSYFMAIYNKQFDDTMKMAATSGISESQKAVVRKKSEILSKLWPAIKYYDSIVARGEIPAQVDEQAILDLINRLAMEG